MVEESSDSPQVLEANELESSSINRNFLEDLASPIDDVNPRRASTGSCHAGEGKPKRNIEKSKSAKNRQNAVPIYLRKSKGSCHDLCKLGRGHSSEEKAKPVARPQKTGKSLPNELIPVQIMVPDGRRKEGKVVNHKPSEANRRYSLDLELSTDAKSSTPKHKMVEKAKVVKIKTSADAKNHSGDSLSRDSKSIQRKTRASTSSPKQSISRLTKSMTLPAKKNPSPDPPEIIKSVCFSSEKVEVPGKKGFSTANKMPKSEKEAVVPSKQQFSSLRVSLVNVKPSFSSEKLDVKRGKEKNLTALKASTKKVSSPKHSVVKIAHIKSRKDGGLKPVSPQKDKNRVRRVKTNTSNEEKASEKTLHVINTETENNVPESIPDDHPTSSFPSDVTSSSLESNEGDEGIEHTDVEADEFVSGRRRSPVMVNIPPVEENHSKTLRKSRTVLSEGRLSSPLKLKFKTGKGVDLKSDNHSPRKLSFRRARVHGGEDSKSAFGRTLKSSGVGDGVASTSTSSVKIVLKHQNVKNKKDAQGLFNNVIEETASKLAESRKSKVKALVGAFETVISLQESKPSTSPIAREL